MSVRSWVEKRTFIDAFRRVQVGDLGYNKLLAAGVDKNRLDRFIGEGGHRKSPSTVSEYPIHELLSRGGHIAGGAATRKRLSMGTSSDVDVFFKSRLDWIQATLATYEDPKLDICFFDNDPCEDFDLAASRCSYSASGWNDHPDFVAAHKTKISKVYRDNIVHPVATLNRMLKYNERYGMTYDKMDVVWIVSRFNVTDEKLLDSVVSISV